MVILLALLGLLGIYLALGVFSYFLLAVWQLVRGYKYYRTERDKTVKQSIVDAVIEVKNSFFDDLPVSLVMIALWPFFCVKAVTIFTEEDNIIKQSNND